MAEITGTEGPDNLQWLDSRWLSKSETKRSTRPLHSSVK
jgi:hypothetical protein